jgi:hypothetical protein
MASKRFRDAVGVDPDRVVSAALNAALGENQSRGKRHHPGRVLAAGAALTAVAAVGQRRMPRLAKVPLRMGLRKLGDMAHVDELADAVRDRLAGREGEPDDDYYDEEDLDDEDYDDDEEPRDELEDQPDDEDDEGFDDEDDEDFDDGPEGGGGPRDEGDEVDDEEFDDEPEDVAEGESDEDEPEGEDPDAVEDDEDLDPEEDGEDVDPEADDEQIAARSLDLGVSSDTNGRRSRDRVPELFEALRTPHRRAPVMRRDSRRVDPATRPPEPDESRPRRDRGRRSNNPKSTAARA